MKSLIFWQLFTLIFWIGFVSAISFFESWLKFRAPGINLPTGLRVGKKVFNSLNRMEWGFLSISAFLFMVYPSLYRLPFFIILGPILLFQTFYLLPILNQRAEKIIAGETISSSWHHWGYILADVSKVIFLTITASKIANL